MQLLVERLQSVVAPATVVVALAVVAQAFWRDRARGLQLPAVLSSLLVLPFLILEVVNRRDYHEGFPISLFGILWLLPAAFMVIAVPVLQSLRARKGTITNPLGLALKLLLLALMTWLWISSIADQMPCFLGVPNCD